MNSAGVPVCIDETRAMNNNSVLGRYGKPYLNFPIIIFEM